MSWINACHASAAQDTLLFSPGVNRFASHPPSLLYPPPTVFAPSLKELGLGPLQSCNQSTAAPIRAFFFFWRKSIVSMGPMKRKRRDVISCCDLEGAESPLKAGEWEAALRGRVILNAHPTPRPPWWCELTEVLPYLSHSLRNLRLQSFPLKLLKKMPFWGSIRS